MAAMTAPTSAPTSATTSPPTASPGVVSNPPWSDTGGWNLPQYYSTIQLGDVNGDGKLELLARDSGGMETWAFDVATGQWQPLSSGLPDWSDEGGWAHA